MVISLPGLTFRTNLFLVKMMAWTTLLLLLPLTSAQDLIRSRYNLIRSNLECRKYTGTPDLEGGICPQLELGHVDAFLPNAETRVDLQVINMMRLFADEFTQSDYWGDREWPRGHETHNCGSPQPHPYWVDPENIEHTTWYAASMTDCELGRNSSHWTCNDDCYLFDRQDGSNECGVTNRRNAFQASPYRVYGSRGQAEAVCGSSLYSCLTDLGHCGIMFHDERRYVGVGNYYSPDTGRRSLLIRGHRGPNLSANWENSEHPIPSGAAFDYRDRIAGGRQTGDERIVVFQATHYKPDGDYDETTGYLIYKGERVEMTRLFGNANKGVYEYQTELPTSCEPYAFEFYSFKDGRIQDLYRLPQEESFFFGTRWEGRVGREACYENHYFQRGGEWYANETPDYVVGSNADCIGCSKIVVDMVGSFAPKIPARPRRGIFQGYYMFCFLDCFSSFNPFTVLGCMLECL